MTEQEIQTLHQSLLNTAATIQNKVGLVATKKSLREEKKEAKELRKAQITGAIAADKILYTNSEMRTAAITEQTALDEDFQTERLAEISAENEQATAEAEAEYHRKKFRADELLLLYYANNQS